MLALCGWVGVWLFVVVWFGGFGLGGGVLFVWVWVLWWDGGFGWWGVVLVVVVVGVGG